MDEPLGDERRTPDLEALVSRVGRHLGGAVAVIDVRRSGEGGIESLTLAVERPGEARVEVDVAHVLSFEAETWEPAPRSLETLVGARGHTMDARGGEVRFRLATWVDSFDAATVAVAVARRLAAG